MGPSTPEVISVPEETVTRPDSQITLFRRAGTEIAVIEVGLGDIERERADRGVG